MGIAKTMNAIGEYDFYSSDYRQFIEKLGELFRVNIRAHFFDQTLAEEEDYTEIEDEYFDFHFSETYNLHVDHFEFNKSKLSQENKYCQYELTIPVQMEYENELSLSFYQNRIFQLYFLPCSNYWKFFIEDIIGTNDQNYKSRAEIVSGIFLS